MGLYDLYNQFKKDKICLSYLGNFNDDITNKIIDLSEFKLQDSGELNKVKNRVSFLIAECFQNIIRHKIDGENKTADNNLKHDKFFQVNIFSDMVCLSSANPVETSVREFISGKINQLNALTEEELKELHQTVLGTTGFSDKGGAGLGLIEMARKSRHPLRYYFSDIDETHSEFFLSLEIINKKEAFLPHEKEIESVVSNYNLMQTGNIVLFYKGDFSKESINSITDMLQPNLLKTESIGIGKKVMIIILELIQNISKHGLVTDGTKSGIFFVSEKENHYQLTCGNFVSKENAQKLNENLNELKMLSVEEVEKNYKNILFNNEISESGNGSLGLLEISKASKNRFDFKIEYVSPEISFFEINVNV